MAGGISDDATSPAWLPALAPPGAEEIGVYWSTIDVDDAAIAAAERSVDAATLARADRMLRPDDRRRIVLAHALLRLALLPSVGGEPSEIPLLRRCAACGSTDHGRPYLERGPSFGLSHGGRIVMVAVGPSEASVAVDVEALRPAAKWEAVRRAAFTADEWEQTAADPSGDRTALWTRKEAVVKATGLGLELPLTRVRPGVGGRPAELAEVAIDDGEPAVSPGPWLVTDLHLAGDHRAAVAARGDAEALRVLAPRAARFTPAG